MMFFLSCRPTQHGARVYLPACLPSVFILMVKGFVVLSPRLRLGDAYPPPPPTGFVRLMNQSNPADQSRGKYPIKSIYATRRSDRRKHVYGGRAGCPELLRPPPGNHLRQLVRTGAVRRHWVSQASKANQAVKRRANSPPSGRCRRQINKVVTKEERR